MAKNQSGGCLSWVALAVALLALLMAWSALRRTGGTVRDVFRGAGKQVESGVDAAERQADLARARATLVQRRAEVEADRNLEQVRKDVAEVRDSLKRAYQDASSETKKQWRELDGDLERLERDLREGGAKALERLNQVVDRIEGAEKKSGGGGS
jgi:hypothetical protein